MKWTKEIPIKEGYYWLKLADSPDAELVSVYTGPFISMRVMFYEDDLYYKIKDKMFKESRWYGPIEAPPDNEE